MTGFKDNGADMFSNGHKVLGATQPVAESSVPLVDMAANIASGITGVAPIPTISAGKRER